jgi:anti-anti-sigma regulatory factor
MSRNEKNANGTGAANGALNGAVNGDLNGKNTPPGEKGPVARGGTQTGFSVMQITGALERSLDYVDKAFASGNDLILDLSSCPFITVEGLEWLEELLLRADSLRLKVRIVKINPVVYKVFKVAHIATILKACDSPLARGPAC